MIYVTGSPRSGTTFVMELCHGLGDRLHYWYDEAWRGGHEDGEFNTLAKNLGEWLLFPLFSDAAATAREGVLLAPSRRVEPTAIREVLERCWSDYDALKDVYGGHTLAVACELGLRPEAVVLCVRDPEEIIGKYGLPSVPLPARLRVPMHLYAVTGLVVTTCLHYDLPCRTAHFPRFVQEPGYAWSCLGGLHGENETDFRFAWELAKR